MVGQTFRREPCCEVPAATARLTPLVKTQGIGECLGNLLGRSRCEISQGRRESRLFGHEPTLSRGGERNKNLILRLQAEKGLTTIVSRAKQAPMWVLNAAKSVACDQRLWPAYYFVRLTSVEASYLFHSRPAHDAKLSNISTIA